MTWLLALLDTQVFASGTFSTCRSLLWDLLVEWIFISRTFSACRSSLSGPSRLRLHLETHLCFTNGSSHCSRCTWSSRSQRLPWSLQIFSHQSWAKDFTLQIISHELWAKDCIALKYLAPDHSRVRTHLDFSITVLVYIDVGTYTIYMYVHSPLCLYKHYSMSTFKRLRLSRQI
jgi:hypothetical protein